MERFHDIFGHPHELIVRWGWGVALHHKVDKGLYGVTQTERERRRCAPDEVFQGERLSSDKLCHNIGEREGEAAEVLPGWSGS